MRFSTSVFFHKSVGPRPLIHVLKLFRIWPRFRGVISKSVVFSCHFPGIYTRKVITCRVCIPGKSSLSGYIDPESGHFPGIYTRKVNFAKKCLKLIFLNSCKTVKTQFLFKKRPWLVSKSLVVWILSKKSWGHLRITFSLSGSIYPESENSFVNISAKTRKKSKSYF